jgi:mannose-6-phosphate isomerase-like protein (cupin superfamily)
MSLNAAFSETHQCKWLGSLGIKFLADGEVGLVEHRLRPRALGAPLHRHGREDEYSYVVSGRVGAKLGDHVVYAGPGELLVKPRGQWHTFWNAGDEEAIWVEVLSPGTFAGYFRELLEISDGGRVAPDLIAPIAARYGLEADPATIPALCAEFGLSFG